MQGESAPAPGYDWRPYNSIRFICRCGRKHTFPRSPSGGKKATCDYTLEDGTRKVVTHDSKHVHCSYALSRIIETGLLSLLG